MLTAQNLQLLDLHNLLSGHLEEEPDLDYPCKDKSKHVNDFRSWSYFKRPQFHQAPINMKSSFLWNDKLVERVNAQKDYMQFTPDPELKGYKETRANLDRKKRAKRMLAIWKKKPLPSYATAADGSLTGRTDSVTVGLSSMSVSASAGGKGRGPGQGRGRGSASPSRDRASRGATRSPPAKPASRK